MSMPSTCTVNKRKPADKLLYNGMGVFNLLVGLLIVFPLIYALFSSFKSASDMSTYPPKLFPAAWTTENYTYVFELAPIFRYMLNSAIVAIAGTLLRLATASTAAFSFAFYEFRGKKVLFFLFLGTMMIPGEAVLVANYINISRAGLMDTYIGMTIIYAVSASGVFIVRQHMRTLPTALHDAALIDGCSDLRFLLSIVLPCSTPVLYTVGISSIVNLWNAYLWPLMITNKQTMRTVQVGITMISDTDNPVYHAEMAGTCFILIPSILIFLLFQRKIVSGITTGAVKS